MPGFIRRFQSSQSNDVLTAIEGAAILDLPPPGRVQGVGTGCVLMVGEAVNCEYAAAADPTTGAVASLYRPVEVLGGNDMVMKLGGFDADLGEFGGAMGNLFVALRNKKFTRLVAVPVNLCASRGIRMWRYLPTNQSATNPTPAVALQPGFVAAGREFRSATGHRIKLAQNVSFTALGAVASGVDGVVAADPAAVTQTFTSATGDFLNRARVGDILVVGVIGAAGAQGSNAVDGSSEARQYRVTAIGTATTLTVQLLDASASTWTWTAGVAQAWRLHRYSDADTGSGVLSVTPGQNEGSYTVLVRPNPIQTTAPTWPCAGNSALNPFVDTPDYGLTGTVVDTWDPLAALTARVGPNAAGIAYSADLHARNPGNTAAMTAEYVAALASTLSDEEPSRSIAIVACSRKARGIANAMRTHILTASANGRGRIACVSPGVGNTALLGTQSADVATSATTGSATDASFGCGATDAAGLHERVRYAWPGFQTYIPEAVGVEMDRADSGTVLDGILDVPADEWLASIYSMLAPERNAGQGTSPATDILAAVLGFQRATTPLRFQMGDYIRFRASGVVAGRSDPTVGWTFQSDVTTSQTSGEKEGNRRRFADYFEDSWAARLVQFAKEPLTDALKDQALTETVAFCEELLSRNNPAGQRIAGYTIEDGSSPAQLEQGIYLLIARIRMVPIGLSIVGQCEVGNGVTVTVT